MPSKKESRRSVTLVLDLDRCNVVLQTTKPNRSKQVHSVSTLVAAWHTPFSGPAVMAGYCPCPGAAAIWATPASSGATCPKPIASLPA
jgi:hypothetical protein